MFEGKDGVWRYKWHIKWFRKKLKSFWKNLFVEKFMQIKCYSDIKNMLEIGIDVYNEYLI